MQVQMRAFVPASIGPWVNAWRESLNDWANSYRPEKHYMRGPGPKWREKHLKAVMPPTLGRLLALDQFRRYGTSPRRTLVFDIHRQLTDPISSAPTETPPLGNKLGWGLRRCGENSRRRRPRHQVQGAPGTALTARCRDRGRGGEAGARGDRSCRRLQDGHYDEAAAQSVPTPAPARHPGSGTAIRLSAPSRRRRWRRARPRATAAVSARC